MGNGLFDRAISDPDRRRRLVPDLWKQHLRTQYTPLDVQAWGESTKKADTMYLHVFNWPYQDGQLILGGLKTTVNKAYLLSDPNRTPLTMSRPNVNDLLINVPQKAPDTSDAVVAIELGGAASTYPGRLLSKRCNNLLRTFDATLSSGVGYGFGELNQDYVTGLTATTRTVKWHIRLNEQIAFTK